MRLKLARYMLLFSYYLLCESLVIVCELLHILLVYYKRKSFWKSKLHPAPILCQCQ